MIRTWAQLISLKGGEESVRGSRKDMSPSTSIWTLLRDTIDSLGSIINTAAESFPSLRIGDDTNYTDIDENGFITLAGDARIHRHIRIGAGSWVKGNTAPTAGFTGVFPHLSFASGADEEAHYTLWVPWQREEGTDMDVVLFWYYTGGNDNADCEWNLTYNTVLENEDPTGAGTALAEIKTKIATDDTLGKTAFTIPGAALTNHDNLGIMIWRDGSDDLSKAAILISAHVHFTMNKLGEKI